MQLALAQGGIELKQFFRTRESLVFTLLFPIMLACAGYLRRPYRRLWPHLGTISWRERIAAIAWVPAIRAIGDVAKMAGYPVGRWWRLQHQAEIPPGHPRR